MKQNETDKKDSFFLISGYIGITIVILLGIIFCPKTDYEGKFFALTFFYFIMSCFFFHKFYEKSFAKTGITHMFHLMNLCLLYISERMFFYDSYASVYLLLLILALVGMIMTFYTSWVESYIAPELAVLCYALLLLFIITELIYNTYAFAFIGYLIAVAVSMAVRLKDTGSKRGWYQMLFLLIICNSMIIFLRTRICNC